MGKIHLNRNRQSLGQFTPEEVAAGLKSGRFLASDLAWREGMDSWKALGEFTDLPPPPPEPPSAVERPAEPEHLGGEIPATPIAPTEIQPAWERRRELGFFTAVVETIKGVLGTATETFSKMPTTGGMGTPMLFYVVVGSVTWNIAAIYQLVFTLINPAMVSAEAKDVSTTYLVLLYVGILFLMPVFVILQSFVSAGIWHLFLLLVGAGKGGFEATYRVVCYTGGATSVFSLIPMCGSLIQFVWNVYALVAGFKEVHKTDTTRSACAVLLPVLLLCACAMGLSLVMHFGEAASAAGAAPSSPN